LNVFQPESCITNLEAVKNGYPPTEVEGFIQVALMLLFENGSMAAAIAGFIRQSKLSRPKPLPLGGRRFH